MRTMKNTLAAIAAALTLGSGLGGCVTDQNFLDDMIYSAKCAGASDAEVCKTKAKQDFDDYQTSKHGGVATASASNGSVPQGTSDRCQTVSASGPISVDAAYVRAMKTFHFTTQEEMDVRARSNRVMFMNPNFKHVRTPGVMYDMWGFIEIPGFEGVRPGTGLRLSKSARGGTDMDVEYCLGYNEPAVSNQAFWDAADRAFKKLVQ